MNDEIREYIEAAATTAAKRAREQFELVAERLEAKIDRSTEALALLDAKLDRRSDAIQDDLRELTARVDVSVAQLNDRFHALEKRVERLEAIVASDSRD